MDVFINRARVLVNSQVPVELAEEAADETVGKLVSAGDAENPKDWLVILNVFILI